MVDRTMRRLAASLAPPPPDRYDPHRSPPVLQQASYQAPGRARRAPRTRPTTVGWLALIIFAFLAGLGAIAAFAVVNTYAAMANDPHMPKPAAKNVA